MIWITILGAFILMLLVVLGLLIGWLITGKIKLSRGTCGRVPQKKGDKSDQGCSLCGTRNKCKDDDDDHT